MHTFLVWETYKLGPKEKNRQSFDQKAREMNKTFTDFCRTMGIITLSAVICAALTALSILGLDN